MKYSVALFCVVIIIFFSNNLLIGSEKSVASNFSFPLNDNYVKALGWGGLNKNYVGKHVAQDYCVGAGDSVYSIADGQVKFFYQKGTCQDNWIYVVVVEHLLPNNKKICSVYGHTKWLDSLKIGDWVTKGQMIGSIVDFSPCSCSHLHFSIYNDQYGNYSGYPLWLAGYLNTDVWPGKYLDPEEFLRQYINNGFYLANGSLFKTVNCPDVYLATSDRSYRIMSFEILQALGWESKLSTIVELSAYQFYTTVTSLFPNYYDLIGPSLLAKISNPDAKHNSSNIFLFWFDGQWHHVLNVEALTEIGYKTTEALPIRQEAFNFFSEGFEINKNSGLKRVNKNYPYPLLYEGQVINFTFPYESKFLAVHNGGLYNISSTEGYYQKMDWYQASVFDAIIYQDLLEQYNIFPCLFCPGLIVQVKDSQQDSDKNKIFILTSDNKFHWIPDEETYKTCYSNSFDEVFNITQEVFDDYGYGEMFGSINQGFVCGEFDYGGGFNDTMADKDGDNFSDLIDNCPNDYNSSQEDKDGDKIGNACDNCWEIYNPEQSDSDQDNIGNLCENISLPDQDGDLISDQNDNCSVVFNPNQLDSDNDSIGDACDLCLLDDKNDEDKDNICGDVDNCPIVNNTDQKDSDSDKVGDLCDNDISEEPSTDLAIKGISVSLKNEFVSGGFLLKEAQINFDFSDAYSHKPFVGIVFSAPIKSDSYSYQLYWTDPSGSRKLKSTNTAKPNFQNQANLYYVLVWFQLFQSDCSGISLGKHQLDILVNSNNQYVGLASVEFVIKNDKYFPLAPIISLSSTELKADEDLTLSFPVDGVSQYFVEQSSDDKFSSLEKFQIDSGKKVFSDLSSGTHYFRSYGKNICGVGSYSGVSHVLVDPVTLPTVVDGQSSEDESETSSLSSATEDIFSCYCNRPDCLVYIWFNNKTISAKNFTTVDQENIKFLCSSNNIDVNAQDKNGFWYGYSGCGKEKNNIWFCLDEIKCYANNQFVAGYPHQDNYGNNLEFDPINVCSFFENDHLVSSETGGGSEEEKEPDSDGDKIVDSLDNCPKISNIDQKDIDSDKVGDVCDESKTEEKNILQCFCNRSQCDVWWNFNGITKRNPQTQSIEEVSLWQTFCSGNNFDVNAIDTGYGSEIWYGSPYCRKNYTPNSNVYCLDEITCLLNGKNLAGVPVQDQYGNNLHFDVKSICSQIK